MKTEDLIRTLAADQSGPTKSLAWALMFGLLPGIVVSILFYAVILGPRPHLFALLAEPRLLFKLIFPWALVACALPVAVRLVQPCAELRRYGALLGLLAAVLAGAVATELLVVPRAHWEASWIGQNARFCLMVIPILAFGPLIGALIVLKHGAPTHPTLAGAGAGLLAAAIGAALYATHCPDDSPLFVACWYGLASVVVVTIGAIAGSRWLRW
jgi:hypothetical protein